MTGTRFQDAIRRNRVSQPLLTMQQAEARATELLEALRVEIDDALHAAIAVHSGIAVEQPCIEVTTQKIGYAPGVNFEIKYLNGDAPDGADKGISRVVADLRKADGEDANTDRAKIWGDTVDKTVDLINRILPEGVDPIDPKPYKELDKTSEDLRAEATGTTARAR